MTVPNSANIVILASNYNPSIVSKEWLYNKGIFMESVDNFVHTPMFALVENQNFTFLVDEQRLQLAIKRVTPDNINKSNEITRKFSDILPETPFKSLGLNYGYTLTEKKCDLSDLLESKHEKLKNIFSDNYQLGAILVFEYESFVVTFTVTPTIIEKQPMKIAFNFHANITNIEELRAKLALQAETLQKAESIIQEICK